MADINQTEASFFQDRFGVEFRITKLASEIGESFIHLYNDIEDGSVGIICRARLSNSVLHYYLYISSTFKNFKLLKGDGIEFHFEDGNLFTIKFDNGKLDWFGEKRNLSFLDNAQLHKLAMSPLSYIKLISKKNSSYLDCHFRGFKSAHYTNKEEGQKLLILSLRRLHEAIRARDINLDSSIIFLE